jgi:hypothetical protein
MYSLQALEKEKTGRFYGARPLVAAASSSTVAANILKAGQSKPINSQ